jgi:hypothetical protein
MPIFVMPMNAWLARADRAPCDQVRDVLRAQQVEELGRGRQTDAAHVEQQLPRAPQPFVDAIAAVEARVVDVAFPADRRARLFEVHAHHDQNVVGEGIGGNLQTARVIERLIVVVDRARPDDGHEAVVATVKDIGDRGAALFDERLHGGRHRQLVLQERRGDQRAHGAYPHIVDAGRILRGIGEADFLIELRIVDAAQGRSPGLAVNKR